LQEARVGKRDKLESVRKGKPYAAQHSAFCSDSRNKFESMISPAVPYIGANVIPSSRVRPLDSANGAFNAI
jgi:hypothetical protein